VSGIVGGGKSPYRALIASEISQSLLVKKADSTSPAVYRSKEDQESQIIKVYEEWQGKGVWSKGAATVSFSLIAFIKNPKFFHRYTKISWNTSGKVA
jgi:hypothetical protein